MLDCSSPHFALVTAETAVMVLDERGGRKKNCIRSPPNFSVQHIIRKESEWIVIQSVRKWESPRRRGEESLVGEKKRETICNGCGYGFPSANLHFDWLASLFSFRFFQFNFPPIYKCTSSLHVHIWMCLFIVCIEASLVCMPFLWDNFVGQPRELITQRAGGHWLAPETSRWVMRLGATASYTHHTVLSPVCLFPGPRRG